MKTGDNCPILSIASPRNKPLLHLFCWQPTIFLLVCLFHGHLQLLFPELSNTFEFRGEDRELSPFGYSVPWTLFVGQIHSNPKHFGGGKKKYHKSIIQLHSFLGWTIRKTQGKRKYNMKTRLLKRCQKSHALKAHHQHSWLLNLLGFSPNTAQ